MCSADCYFDKTEGSKSFDKLISSTCIQTKRLTSFNIEHFCILRIYCLVVYDGDKKLPETKCELKISFKLKMLKFKNLYVV